nr:hypothetical protein [Tanacetum cinerariifolium]
MQHNASAIYHIRNVHSELPGREDRIVDFPEGKVLPKLATLRSTATKRPRKNTPKCYTKPLDFLNNCNNCFFWVDERVFSTVVDWQTNVPKDGMPADGTYSVEAVRAPDMYRTPIQKQPELLLCVVRISRKYYLGDEVNRLIQFDSCPKSYEATDSSGVPSTIKRSLVDLAHEAGASDRGTAAPEMPDHADLRPSGSSHGGKSLAAIQLDLASNVFVPEGAPADINDPDPLFFADAPSRHPADVVQSSQGIAAAGDPESENVSSPAKVEFEQEAKLLRKSVAQVARRDKRIQARELEIKNLEELLEAEADMKKATEGKSVGLIQELEDMRARFLDIQVSNEHLSQQVATLQNQVSGEEKLKAAFEEFKRYEDDRVERRCVELDAYLDALSIDFDEEIYPHMLTAIVGHRWVIGHGLRLAIMKCDESLEMKQAFADVVSARVAKGMSEGLKHGVEHGQAQIKLEGLKDAPMDVIMASLYLKSNTREDALQSIRDLRPSSSQLTIPVYLERCAELDARLDVLSIDFDEELYPHMLTAIAGRRWVIGHGLRLVMMKCAESLEMRQAFADVVSAGVAKEVRDPRNPWACKEEIALADAIAANISRAEKKKKCRIVCRTHGVGSTHHARSDGIPVSVPSVVPQGLALLLVDGATQTDPEESLL